MPVQGLLLDVAKEHMQLRGSVMYKEDMKPDGIWLIANGVVKVGFTYLICILSLSMTLSISVHFRPCAGLSANFIFIFVVIPVILCLTI